MTKPSVLVKMEEKRSWRWGRGGGGIGGDGKSCERGWKGGWGGYVNENEGVCKDSLLWQKSSWFEDLPFFLLPNKTEWDLVYSPETVCLHLRLAVHTVQWNWICRLGRYLILLCLPGRLQFDCSWTAPQCESPQVISLAKYNYLHIFGIFFCQTLNCHYSSTFRAFDLIPKLRARPEYQLSSAS